MHENRTQKVGFDIDRYGNADPLPEVKQKILEKFPNADMNISGSKTFIGSNSNWKYSYHIVLQNYIVKNVNHLLDVKEWCAMLTQKRLGFDPPIFRINSLLKCINQSKGDKDHDVNPRIQNYVEGSTVLFDHTILYNIREDAIVLNTASTPKKRCKDQKDNEHKTKKQKLANVSKLPRMNSPVPVGFDLHDTEPFQLLEIMSNPPRGHEFQISNDIFVRCHDGEKR